MFLYLGHMNNVMDVRLSWKVQPVCNNANSLQDFVRSKEPEWQFLITAGSQGHLHIRLHFEIYQIINLELPLGEMFISLHFHALLSMQELML
jgi:hypothetical protein